MRRILALLLMGAGYAAGQTYQPLLQPHQSFVTSGGFPCSSCRLYTYAAGTTTPLATYTDASGLVLNSNPIILDAAGAAAIWTSASSYKLVLKDSLDELMWTADNIPGASSGGGGSGISSVTWSLPSWLSASPTTLNASGTQAFSAATGQTAHQVIGTCGAATVFGPCALVAGDIPSIAETQVINLTTDLAAKVDDTTTVNGHALGTNIVISASDLTTGTLPHAQLPALIPGDIPNNAANTTGTAGGLTGTPSIAVTNLNVSGTCTGCGAGGGGSGTVTSVAMTVPAWLAVAGSPITTSGTLAVTAGSETANTVLAAPNGSSGTPSFRALASADIPNNAANTTGTSTGLTGNPSIGVTNLTISGTCTGCPGAGSLPNATDTKDKVAVNGAGVASLLTPANDVYNVVLNGGIDNTGVTDVSTAIASLITGLPSSQPYALYFPAGVYKINSGILVPCTSSTCNAIRILGAGRDNTVFQTNCSGHNYGLWLDNTTNSGDNWIGPTIENLTIQDTSGTGGACSDLLKLTQIAEANISRVKLMSAQGHTYSTGTIATSGSTVTGTGTTFAAAMVPGVLQVNGVMAEVCGFTSATSLTLCDIAWPTGTVAAGSSFALAYGGRGLTFDPGFSFTQYITVRDLFTYGDLFGVYSMGTSNGGNSRITFDGDASWNDGLRIANSVAYFLGKHTDTFHIKTPANLVTRCWVLDSAHANEISGDCENNSTYTVVTTCNGGVATQSCVFGAEVSADATTSGYGNAFTSPYVYLAGTAFRTDNANGATNLTISGLRGASFANTNSYNFAGTTGCPISGSGLQATINDFDCVYSPLTSGIANVTITTGTTSVTAGNCLPLKAGSATSQSMPGLASTSTLTATPNTDVVNTSGFGPGDPLYLDLVPGSGTFTWRLCNSDLAAAHTPGASVTWNVSAR